ncbi:MAG TPA: MBL fold metallo-hydrolase [Methanomassiliicoccales archaeon]|jgi:glyoxylase-like metal-dependent hydrolase (beta-lactamase superfamily II)
MTTSRKELRVFTASQEALWINSTLICGERDAILIDAQFTLPDARKLVTMIRESGRELRTVYITHHHPDHYFGLQEIVQAFPDAQILAQPTTVESIRKTWKGKVEQWAPVYGNNITTSPVIPTPMTGMILELEGEMFPIYMNAQGDDRGNSYVWIPSLKAVICGDIVYNGVYPWTADTSPAERKEWLRSLEKIESLRPATVVAGHKDPTRTDDPSCIQFMKDYLNYYDAAVITSRTADELKAAIKKRFTGLGLDIILNISAGVAFPSK